MAIDTILSVPICQSLMWSTMAWAALAALLNFLNAITAAPLFCTVLMNSPLKNSSLSLFNNFSPLLLAFATSGNWVPLFQDLNLLSKQMHKKHYLWFPQMQMPSKSPTETFKCLEAKPTARLWSNLVNAEKFSFWFKVKNSYSNKNKVSIWFLPLGLLEQNVRKCHSLYLQDFQQLKLLSFSLQTY